MYISEEFKRFWARFVFAKMYFLIEYAMIIVQSLEYWMATRPRMSPMDFAKLSKRMGRCCETGWTKNQFSGFLL